MSATKHFVASLNGVRVSSKSQSDRGVGRLINISPSTGYLTKQHPVMVIAPSKSPGAERIKREKEVRQVVIQIHKQGLYPTPRLVAERLNKPAYFGRRDVAIVIRKTREELDSKNR